MNSGVFRFGAACAMILAVAACGGGSASSSATPSPKPPIDQAAYTKSLASYMTAAQSNFQGFSTQTPLVASAECNVDHPGKDNAVAECRVDNFDNEKYAKTEYDRQKAVFVKALPPGTRGAEQANAVPGTPLRYTAVSGKSGAVLILTQQGPSAWVVGYVFQKVPG